ncbi:roadblock/LC7 domain-containing protein [Amycolatopsis mediterranei]|jgi:predicted regulator of Ras-like GTPase activity (Roadblock/LC7/MglB family)|uniref:roadblock/LC7 domain-containing protein n=1 Tax=Amycolatopsis mediterranei TaxID=33910 RepID=UPI003434B292
MAESSATSLDWLLDDFVRRLADAQRAVVLTADGLLLGRSSALSKEEGEHLSAMASAFQSLARGVGRQFTMGQVHQTVVELDEGFLVITEAGDGAGLALLASLDADMGMVAYEMNVIVHQVGRYLSAAPRDVAAELRILSQQR